MGKEKPSIPKGTRDFGSEQMKKRNIIFNTIRNIYEKYGFQPLETPTMEKLSVLTGKYGDEGDQLLFKVLNSGDFLNKTSDTDIQQGYKHLTSEISEKGLRYDLTVPFARYVVMNQGTLTFPFKRYQIQPVWRADRPQKGRYREFYQCDADVVGTESLICEAEIVAMICEVFRDLRITDFTIKLNNRKILAGIAEAIGEHGKESELCVAIDKLDKIGLEKVNEELSDRGFESNSIQNLQPILETQGDNTAKIEAVKSILESSETGKKGVNELEEVFRYMNLLGLENPPVEFDITLARGLSYYTGAIFEVKANNVQIGSITGGGRYDNLTGVFGLEGTSGVGISFGVDRIYDVMKELKLFPSSQLTGTEVLIVSFDSQSQEYCLPLLQKLREANIKAEIYPESKAKLKKQMNYANNKHIPFTILAGSQEIEAQKVKLKNMETGDQDFLSFEEVVTKLKSVL